MPGNKPDARAVFLHGLRMNEKWRFVGGRNPARLCPAPHQGDDLPVPTFADISICDKKAVSRCCVEKTAKLAAVELLARRLKAANPDAKPPGKAEE